MLSKDVVALTTVREESSILSSEASRPDASPTAQSLPCRSKAGPNNDNLPTIKAGSKQQWHPTANSLEARPAAHHQLQSSQQTHEQPSTQQPWLQMTQHQHASQHTGAQLQTMARQPLTSIAAAAAAAMRQHQRQWQAQPPNDTSSCQSACRSPQRLPSPQHQPCSASQLQQQRSTASSTDAAAPGRRVTCKTRSRSTTQSAWPHGASHRTTEEEEDPFLAQRRLHQLPGLEGVWNPVTEAAAGKRITALPHVLCRAANGELYKMETGHVQSMMLRRHLAELGIDMTDEEEALLTAGAVNSTHVYPARLPAPCNAVVNSNSETGSIIIPSGSNTSGDGDRHTTASPSQSIHNTSLSGSPGRTRLRRTTAAPMAPGAGGLNNRRSAVGVALDAHAAEAMRSQEQVILDDEVMEHVAQLDSFIEGWRLQLAQQAESRKAAKAFEAMAATKQASSNLSRAASMHCDTHRSRRWHGQSEQRARANLSSNKAEKEWDEDAVELSIANWEQRRADADRWKQHDKPPTWEDVILMGDVYIKHHSGQGATLYEASCAELGITPCGQVIQQLEEPDAKMAHCKLGFDGAKALAAALAVAVHIRALDLRDNGLDGKATSLILAGIATATASALTDRVKQRNMQMAAHFSPSMGMSVRIQTPAAAQPLDSSPEGSAGSQGAAPGHLVSSSTMKQQRHASINQTVAWDIDDRDMGSMSNGDLRHADSSSGSKHRGLVSAVSWAGSRASGSGANLISSDTCLYGGASADYAAAAGAGNEGPDWPTGPACEKTRGSMDSNSNLQLGDSDLGTRTSFQRAGDEAQLALQALSPRAVSRSSLAKLRQQQSAAGSRLYAATGSSSGSGAAGQDAVGSPTSGVQAADFELDIAESVMPGSASSPASPTVFNGAAATLPSLDDFVNSSDDVDATSMVPQQAGAASYQQGLTVRGSESGGRSLTGGRNFSVVMDSRVRHEGVAESGSVYSALTEMDLSQNPIGPVGAKAFAQLLNPEHNPGQFLVSLKLSKCSIPESGGIQIAAALQAGNLKLKRLCLSNNNLGNKSAAAFGELLESSHTLKELDLGWNQIKAEGAKALARGLAANATLSELVLCWNGLEAAGGAALGDMLALNMGLLMLDLSHCRLGPEACLLLAEGLKRNVVLEVLLLSGNDIGEDGARHLMSALASNNSLKYLGLNGSNLTSAVHDGSSSVADFNPANPDGSYTLDLSVAAERAVAVQLVELDRAHAVDLMKNITLDGKAVGSVKKANWPTLLPSRGTLSCRFTSSNVKKPLAIMDSGKLATLRRQLTAGNMIDRDRLELVAMFAPFALFTCKQIASVLGTFSDGPEYVAAAALLFTRAADSAADLTSLTSPMTGHDLLGWKDVLGWYAGYRWNQPTGHYELNLALPVHAAIAARLRDDSQSCPDGPTWINLLHDMATSCFKQPQSHGPPPDWRSVIPTSGTVSLDYVSTQPPGAMAQTLIWGAPSTPTVVSSNKVTATASANTRSSLAAGGGRGPSAESARRSTAGPAAGSAGSGAVGGSVTGGEGELCAATEQQLTSLMRSQMGISLAPGESTAAAAAAVALSDVAAADAAVTALRQAIASGLLLNSAQVRMLVEAFRLSPHRVEVAVMCWPCTLDRDDNYWTVLYCLQGLEQSNLLQRIGPWRLFHPQHASCHWVLDLCNPGHEEVAKKLVALAVSGGEPPNLWNLRLRGVRKQVNENSNMWGMLTAESFTPFLEFDFLGPDAWTALGKSEKEVASMAAGDKLEMRSKQAARLEATRMKQLYPYSCDGSKWLRPAYASYSNLMSPQLMKSPWVAAWDRLVRVLLRLELWSGSLTRDSSALQEAFESAAESQQEVPELPEGLPVLEGAPEPGELCISATELEELLRSWGHSRQEVAHYLKLMEDHLKAEAAARAAAAADRVAHQAAEAAREAAAAAAGQQPADSESETSTPRSQILAAPSFKGTAVDGKASRPASRATGTKPSSTGSAADGITTEATSAEGGGPLHTPRKVGATRFASVDDEGSAPSSSRDKGGSSAAAAPGDISTVGAKGGKKTGAPRSSNNGAITTSSRPTSRPASAKSSALAANLEATYNRGLTFNEFLDVIMTDAQRAPGVRDSAGSSTATASEPGSTTTMYSKAEETIRT